MIIYLKYDDHVESVGEISLKEGFIPVIGDSLPVLPGSSEPLQLDPSLWYKTLVVDAVYIDCNDRDVRWTRLADGDRTQVKCQRFFPDHAQQLHSIDVYDFDPTKDEFLDRSVEVMSEYITQKTTKQERFKLDVVRLMHCYILPLLQFDQQDAFALENLLSYIENQHEHMELTLLTKTEELQRTENVLQKQREKCLLNEQFDSEKYVWSCKREFLAAFLCHVEKDINSVSLEMDQLSEHITSLKKTLKENGSDKCEQTLAQHRESRDKVFEWLVKLQIVRETIKNVTCRPIRTKKNKYKKIKINENVLHNIYIELDNRIKQQKDNIQSLIMKKVRMSSVREAVYGVLCALRRSKGATSPIETADGSEYSLEIIGLQSKPADWDTLEEKVRQQFDDTNTYVYTEHISGCRRICDLAQACLTETSMFGLQTKKDSLPASPGCVAMNLLYLGTQKYESGNPSNRLSQQGGIGIDKLSSSNVNLALENIKESFRMHMDRVSSILMKSIPNCTHHENKIWLLYETILSPECLPKLLSLYKLSVLSTCQAVHKMLNTLSLRQIVNGDQRFFKLLHVALHIKTQDITHYEDKAEANPPSPFEAFGRPVSNASLISIEIQKCTLEELYSMADKDCNVLVKQFAQVSSDEANATDESPSSSNTNLTSSSEETDAEDEEAAQCSLEDITITEEDYKTKLSEMFATTKNLIQKFLKAKTIMDKLRKLTQMYREIGKILSTVMEDRGMVCCDEMLSMMIVLLWSLDMDMFVNVYANIKLLIDLMPDFLMGHIHDCALTNFSAAYQMLFDTECLHRKSVSK